jgi:tetratricopeptide (TPR) repeat protein
LSTVARRYYVRAVEALGRGERDAARDDLHAALELAPDFVAARIVHARLLAGAGDARAAVASLSDGLARNRRGGRSALALQRALVDACLALGDYAEARRALERAREMAPDLAAFLADRSARLHARSGRFAEALDDLLIAARASGGGSGSDGS